MSPVDSLQYQLAKARENLRLIQERKAEFVLSTEIPLQLVKDERRLLDEIAELEQQLAAQPVEDGTKRTPKQLPERRGIVKTQVIVAVVAVAAIIGVYWLLVLKPLQPSSMSTPVPQQIEYVGHVFDAKTQAPIRAAKVTLDFQGAPPIVYTDSEGVYRFTIVMEGDRLAGRVRLEASGYENYDRNITLMLNAPTIEEIRLEPLASTATATAIPLPTTNVQAPALTSTGAVTLALESVEMTFELYGSGLEGAEVTIQTSTGLTVMTIYISQGTRQTVTLPPGNYTYKVEAKGLVLPTPWPCWTAMERDSGGFSVRGGASTLVTIPIGQYEILGCKPSSTDTPVTAPTPTSTPTPPSLTSAPIPTYTGEAITMTQTPWRPDGMPTPIVAVLKTYHNLFVRIDAAGVLAGDADQSAAEVFALFHLSNDKVILRTFGGQYITADKSEPWSLRADAQDLDKAQQFTLIDLGEGMVAFETDSNRYVTAMMADFGWRLRTETTNLREYKRFTLLPLCYRAAGAPCRPPDTGPNWTKVMNFKGESAGRACTDTIHISPPQLAVSIYISMTAKPPGNPNWGYSLWEVQAYKSETDSDNLAKLGSVIASSVESPALLGGYATDGDLSTRWSSEWQKDPQWLEIVLPTPAAVGRVELVWETAVAQDYCVFVIPSQ